MLNRQTIMQVAVLTIISWISTAGLAQSSDSVVSTTEQIRLAVSRSLPYLESAGESWMKTKKCVSCHRVSFMTWSFDAAARNGFEVDQPKLQEWVRWSVSKSLDQTDKEKPVDGELNIDGLSQLILAHPAGSSATLQDEARQEFVRLILKTQQDDGSWKPAGQLPSQKRPELETRQVSTMWNVLALRAASQTPETNAASQRALEWLKTSQPGKSTEWYTVRLLLSISEEEATELESARTQLRSMQKDDGGWGWLTDDPSDALATGLVMYALAVDAADANASAMQRAQQFLITTQDEDGSWKVNGTKEKKKSGVEETATYWGTAWATIGLLQTLSPAKPISQ